MSDENTNTETIVLAEEQLDPAFDEDLIRKYPRANRKLSLQVNSYGLFSEEDRAKSQTSFISPYGLQFQGQGEYEEGALLKIHVQIPDYWARKQKFVQYQRVDTPGTFKILAKVVRTEDIGKRGKKKMVVAQTVNMDEVDEKVLKSFLQDG